MFKNILISTKLKLNLFIMIIGLAILGFITYNSFDSLSKNYDKSNFFASSTDNLKSMFIGGLLYNSASGVVKQNPNSTKAKATMKKGIDKVSNFATKQQKLNRNSYNQFAPMLNDFISTANIMLDKVNSNQHLTKDDMKKSLMYWRKLKFDLMKQLSVIKKESKKKSKNLFKTT